MLLGGFQHTTFALTAPLRFPLQTRRIVSPGRLSNQRTDAQTDGHREGYATFVGSFNIVRDPCTSKP